MDKPIVKYGVYYGIISIIVTLLVWMFFKHLFTSWLLLVFILFIQPLPFLILACREEKENNNGYLKFGKAFKTCMGVAFIGICIASIFNYTLHNFIDPQLGEYMKEESIEVLSEYESKMSEEIYEMSIERIENEDYSSMVSTLKGLFSLLFVQLFIALIVSLIMKKNNPDIFSD